MNGRKPVRDLLEDATFWSLVDQSGGIDACWPWQGKLNPDGYGVVGGRSVGAHRIAWAKANAKEQGALCVLHTCDNRPCCNPKHLYLGTQVDNVRDRTNRGRAASGDRNGARLYPERILRGDRHPMHLHPEKAGRGSQRANAVLTEEQVLQIRLDAAAGIKPADLARQHGLARSKVSALLLGQRWKHVGGPLRASTRTRRLTQDEVQMARSAHALGETFAALSRRLGVSNTTVRNAVLGLKAFSKRRL